MKIYAKDDRKLMEKIVRAGGRLRQRATDACFRFAGLLFYLAIRLLEPFRRVGIGVLHAPRIGHLAGNTELFLRRRAAGLIHSHDWHVFFCGYPIANRQLLSMFKRRLRIWEHPVLWSFYERGLKPLVEGTRFSVRLVNQANSYHEFNHIPPQLAFTEPEERAGRALLKTLGDDDGSTWVCMHARDPVFLDQAFPYRTRQDWSYHDYRDSDIRHCMKAAGYLAERGLWVFRMGAVVSQPIESPHPRVVDYATRHRTDFGDIYLCGKCKFFLASNSGPAQVSTIFNRPIAVPNIAPVGYLGGAWRQTDLFIPKKYWSVERKRFMTFREIFASGADRWVKTELFKGAGIELIENTPEEILALAREMNNRLDGVWQSSDEDEDLQGRFKALFDRSHPSHGFPSRIGAEFLRQNRELLA